MDFKKIQTGCIQTILNGGRFLHYRASLWVPEEYARLMGFKDVQTFSSKHTNKKNKYLYCPTHKEWDAMWQLITNAQILINLIKIEKLHERQTQLVNRALFNS